jgi:hypothetical protein
MTASVADIVAQLLQVRERLAAAAVTTMRAQADAEHAHGRYSEAGSGTEHPQIREAITDIRTASDKAARAARLLNEARSHLTKYLNKIAPGSANDSDVSDAEMPSGERLLSEAERRGRKADIIWRKQVKKAEDTESTLKQVEDGGKAVFSYFRQQQNPGTTSAGTSPPKPPPPQDRPQVDNPITAAIMATGAVAVAAKAAWNHIRKQRERKREDDDQA